MNRVIATLAALLAVSTAHAEPSSDAVDRFKSAAASSSTRLKQRPEYLHPGCDLRALLGPIITRSNDPLLHAGDRVVSVGGVAVDEENRVAKLLFALPPGGTVRLGVVRGGKRITVSLKCVNSADTVAAEISAFDAAAAGDFPRCIEAADRYRREFVQFSAVYNLWRKCHVAAGQLTGQALWTTLVEYWTLRLQELRYRPTDLESARPRYLTALTEIVNAGQPVLADELRKQWSIASGEPLQRESIAAAPRGAAPRQARQPRTYAPSIARRSGGGDCESGHWIDSVMDDGSVVKLEDGSLWRVDDADTVDSALWLPATEIVVCDGKLINTDDNESVDAERIR